jgi:inosine-uridine nucleoside N-ribohydrolase
MRVNQGRPIGWREDVPVPIGIGTRMNGELPQVLRDAYAGDRGRAGLVDICSTYLDAPMFDWANGCVLYDPLAVTADPGIASFQGMAVGIETSGALALRQTVPMRDQKPKMRVCVSVDGVRIVGKIVRTILAPPEGVAVNRQKRSHR